MRKIDLFVIHCSDTPASMDIGADTIRDWHRQNGWSDIGYHLVITRNGTLEKGRDFEETGAHAYGFNSHSIGICMVGGRGKNGMAEANFTKKQWLCLFSLYEDLKKRYPEADWKGHNELSEKPCPSFDVKALLVDN